MGTPLQLEEEDERTVFLDAIEESLRPLMRAVYEYGISYHDLIGVVRALYVISMRDRCRAEERPISDARIGLITGVTREQVVRTLQDRLRKEELQAQAAKIRDQLLTLLARWHDDPDYSTPYGAPIELSLSAEGTFKTWDQLISSSGIELDRDTAIAYLLRAGCIEVHEPRFVRCINRNLLSKKESTVRIAHLGHASAAHNTTLVRNLLSTDEESRYFERATVSDFPISEYGRDQLLAYLKKDGGDFLGEIDRWISDREADLKASDGRKYGISLYFYENFEGQFGAQGNQGPSKKAAQAA